VIFWNWIFFECPVHKRIDVPVIYCTLLYFYGGITKFISVKFQMICLYFHQGTSIRERAKNWENEKSFRENVFRPPWIKRSHRPISWLSNPLATAVGMRLNFESCFLSVPLRLTFFLKELYTAINSVIADWSPNFSKVKNTLNSKLPQAINCFVSGRSYQSNNIRDTWMAARFFKNDIIRGIPLSFSMLTVPKQRSMFSCLVGK